INLPHAWFHSLASLRRAAGECVRLNSFGHISRQVIRAIARRFIIVLDREYFAAQWAFHLFAAHVGANHELRVASWATDLNHDPAIPQFLLLERTTFGRTTESRTS